VSEPGSISVNAMLLTGLSPVGSETVTVYSMVSPGRKAPGEVTSMTEMFDCKGPADCTIKLELLGLTATAPALEFTAA